MNQIMSSEQICGDIIKRISNLLKMAENFYDQKFEFPIIDFEVKGTKAGVAYYRQWRISLNLGICINQPEHFIRRTVAHELAHLISWKVYNTTGHDKCFYYVMQVVFDVPEKDSTRCHSYDMTGVQTRRHPRFEYICICNKLHHLTGTQHKRVQEEYKAVTYSCSSCRRPLKKIYFTGQTIKL